MIRFHDWRSVSATVDGVPLQGEWLEACLSRWRAGHPVPGLQVYATLPAQIPLSSPAQVVWQGWPGLAPRSVSRSPARLLEQVTLVLPSRQADLLRQCAIDRGLSVGAFVAKLVDLLELQTAREQGKEYRARRKNARGERQKAG